MATQQSTIDLSSHFRPETATDKRIEVIQLLYEEPGHKSDWYAENTPNGVSEWYVSKLKSDHPEIADHNGDGYCLTDQGRKALIDAGTIEPDDVAELQHDAEEPSQQAKPGEITIVGELDATRGSDAPQMFQDRPVKNGQSNDADDTDDDTGGSSMNLFMLTSDQAFDVIRQVDDDDLARELYDQMVAE